MQIDNFAQIIWGEIENSPLINSFENIIFEAKNIRRGDIFIAIETSQIEEAIKNGAYGIVYQKKLPILDKEIAWIRVKNIKDAITDYLRYFLISKENIYYFNEIEIELMKSILTDRRVLILTNNFIEDFKAITNRNYDFLIISNRELAKKLEADEVNFKDNALFEIVTSTIFKTTILYKKTLYKELKIPQLYLSNLFKVISFLDNKKIEYNLEKLNFIPYFYPVYINEKLEKVEFGKSQKVLIFTKESPFLEKEIKFLKEKIKWTKSRVFTPKKNNRREEFKKFSKKRFTFGLIVGDEKEYLEEKREESISLF